MAHGHEDYYSGMVLYGIVSGEMVPINLDSGGNLVALLKAMYGSTPTVLACDADGNLNVNVAVALAAIGVEPKDGTTVFKVTPDGGAAIMKVAEQTPLTTIKVAPTDANPTFKVTPDGGAAIMKVAEQTPLTSIQIEPKSGMGNLKVDINAQTLTSVTTDKLTRTFASSVINPALSKGNYITFLNITGKGLVIASSILIVSCTDLSQYQIKATIDGVDSIVSYSSNALQVHNAGMFGYLFNCFAYDDINKYLLYSLSNKLRFNTSFAIKIYSNDSGTPLATCVSNYYIT